MRQALTPCKYTVSELFHPPSGVFFSFPSRYLFTIDQKMYLALPHSRGSFPQDFSGPVVLKNDHHEETGVFCVQDFHLLWCHFPEASTIRCLGSSVPGRTRHDHLTTPHLQRLPSFASRCPRTCVFGRYTTSQVRFRLFPVRSPLLRE